MGGGGRGEHQQQFLQMQSLLQVCETEKELKAYFTSRPKSKVLPRPYDMLPFTHEKKRHEKWVVVNICYKEQSPPPIASDITDLFELHSFAFEGNVFLPLSQHYNAVVF